MDDRNLFRSVLSECADEHVCARKHLLLFNVSAILSHEVVQTAELRLFKIVERDRYVINLHQYAISAIFNLIFAGDRMLVLIEKSKFQSYRAQ